MKQHLKWLLATVLVCLAVPAQAKGITEKGLKRILRSKILMAQGIAANRSIVDGVLQQNAKSMTLTQIKALDQKWRSQKILTPFKLSYQTNPSGSYIKDIIENDPDIFSEIFVTDNQGANVAAFPATSDYWQGDEDKWIKSWAQGKGDVYLSKVEFDESSKVHAIQIAVPIKHKGLVIGVLVIGIKLTHVQASYLLRNLDKRLIEQQ